MDSKYTLWIGTDDGSYLFSNNQLGRLDNSKDAYAIEEINGEIIKGGYKGKIEYWDGKQWKLKWDLTSICTKIFSIESIFIFWITWKLLLRSRFNESFQHYYTCFKQSRMLMS